MKMLIRIQLPIFIAIILSVSSCKKVPETDFTYSPAENPEAGIAIEFQNTTENGNSFDWTFGDGGFSSDENPSYIFEKAGSYDVKLTATNDAGEQAKTKTLEITEPTNLGFFIFDSTFINLLEGAEVLLYDNQIDWDNFEEPLQAAVSDAEGRVLFTNLQPMVYFIWALKEEAGGIWISGGYTPELEQNETSLFNVPCVWLPEEGKSTRPVIPPVKYVRRVN